MSSLLVSAGATLLSGTTYHEKQAIPATIPDDGPRPFLKWPGGKRWLATEILNRFPTTLGRYFEPFLGGGALFFKLLPQNAILSDSNRHLIEAYRQVQGNVEPLIERLQPLSIFKEEFYRIRASRPTSQVEQAVRFIYLNRTAFNGMYRVNRRGEFNVPFGCKPGTVICDATGLRTASRALQGAELLCADFEEIMERAGRGDLVYADPPYTTKHDNNGFRRYNESIFSWSDQERLAVAAKRCAERGATVVVSNAHHEDLHDLYGDFECSELARTSCISGKIAHRGRVEEYPFVSKDGSVEGIDGLSQISRPVAVHVPSSLPFPV